MEMSNYEQSLGPTTFISKTLLITDQNIFGMRYSNSHGLQLLMSYL